MIKELKHKDTQTLVDQGTLHRNYGSIELQSMKFCYPYHMLIITSPDIL
jgi:hypothetical protein